MYGEETSLSLFRRNFFTLYALVSVVLADQFHTICGPGSGRWQEKPLKTGQLHMFDRQIDANFAVIP